MSWFVRDRDRGKHAERICALLLRLYTHHKQATVVPAGEHIPYDVWDPGTGRKMEVKGDWRSRDTGHYIVEHHFGESPSGVSVTTADDWIFWDGASMSMISVDALVLVIRDVGQERSFRGPGDYTLKRAYRVPVVVVRKEGVCIDAPREIATMLPGELLL